MVQRTMYTIKQAAARSGVPVQLLRAWERRYGVVKPERTESGYRLYDEAAIDRLRLMRRRIDDGWAPSTAAREIREMDNGSVSDALRASTVPPSATPTPNDAGADDLTEAFVASAAALDEEGFESLLDAMFARGSFEQVASELLMPALVAIGEGWADGTVDVAGEHAASSAVQRRLATAFLAAGRASVEHPLVLVGLPPGARHDLGALTFATALRRRGISVRFLGADLPIENWLEAIERTSAEGVVIGVVMGADVGPATAVARAVREANPEILIAFGGRSAASIEDTGLSPALILPSSLGDAVQQLRATLPAG
jgi:DNA-binding transcriptional MerR regulator/methylmalonyl-CoA mutase cobalamin-binding subunit